jgi:hypothetical protein
MAFTTFGNVVKSESQIPSGKNSVRRNPENAPSGTLGRNTNNDLHLLVNWGKMRFYGGFDLRPRGVLRKMKSHRVTASSSRFRHLNSIVVSCALHDASRSTRLDALSLEAALAASGIGLRHSAETDRRRRAPGDRLHSMLTFDFFTDRQFSLSWKLPANLA